MNKKEDSKTEAKRCVSSARDSLDKAIRAIDKGERVSVVRGCFSRVREFLADSQEYLRELKRAERNGR